MEILILILVFLLFVYMLFDKWLSNKRDYLNNHLRVVYEEMELVFILEELTPNKKNLDYLLAYKRVARNPELVDIQVLIFNVLANKEVVKERLELIRETEKGLPQSLIERSAEFNETIDILVKYSVFRWGFVSLFFSLLLKLALALIKSQVAKVRKTIDHLKEVRREVRRGSLVGDLSIDV